MFVCNKWCSIYYFFYNYYWSTCRNRKFKFYFNFFINNWKNKKITEYNKKFKKKHDKVLVLPKSKLNSIGTLVSQALIDMEISNEEFITILNEKDKYEKMKENVRNISKKKTENMRLNNVNSRSLQK